MISTRRVNDNGDEYWELPNGQVHREDGPAVTYANGTTFWIINGEYHREDGPAIIRSDGTKKWYANGKRHREDGPSIMWPDGSVDWYLDDISYHFNFYSHKLKRDYGKTDEDIMLLRMQYAY